MEPSKKFQELSPADLEELRRAVEILERGSFTARVSQLLGRPFDELMLRLPEKTTRLIVQLTQQALEHAFEAAIRTLPERENFSTSPLFHKVASGLSGLVGGGFGMVGLALELPVTVTLMLRAIAAIAQRHREDPRDLEVRLHCLEVFALGEPKAQRNRDRSGYYAVRVMLGRSLRRAARELMQHETLKKGTPFLVQFIQQVATRFGLHISKRVALQMMPTLSAMTTAALNIMFMEFYCELAEAHFTIRELERRYGEQQIEQLYYQLLTQLEEFGERGLSPGRACGDEDQATRSRLEEGGNSQGELADASPGPR